MRRMLRLLVVGLALMTAVRLVRARRSRGGLPAERERGAPLAGLRDLVTHRFNPVVVRLGLAGGSHSPLAMIEHVGATTGHLYRSPVEPLSTDEGFEIPLAYGTDVHWARNVLAAGGARLQLHDTIFELDQPEIISGEDARSLSGPLRRVAERAGWHYLRLRTVSKVPGSFTHLEGHPVPMTAGGPMPMPAEGPFAEYLPPPRPGGQVPVEPKMTQGKASEKRLTTS